MSHGGGGGGFGPLWWLVGLIIVFWAMWYMVGGPERANKDQPFMAAPSPLGSGEVYGPSGPTVQENAPAPLEETTPGTSTY